MSLGDIKLRINTSITTKGKKKCFCVLRTYVNPQSARTFTTKGAVNHHKRWLGRSVLVQQITAKLYKLPVKLDQ
jgi:hypothetical protein